MEIKANCSSAPLAAALAEVLAAAPSLSCLNDARYTVLSGFCDVHVHFREPGFSYKETIATGCRSAARGGYTAVCAMPNLKPVPDTPEHLALEWELIRQFASIDVRPYAAITLGERGEELCDFAALAAEAVAFSDDGKGVQSEAMMREAMTRAAALGKIIAAHCEDESLLRGGYIHDGDYAKFHDHRGICSESEWRAIERDLTLVRETGCAYHVCHISTKESVALIRQAKAEGLNVSCETAPHYLLMDDRDLQEDGRFKMNPPLRSADDRAALVEGLLDGTIDMIATDHAPHSAEEKARGLEHSAFGVVGLETAFAAMYTGFVKTGLLSLAELEALFSHNPRRRFGLPAGKDFSVWDLNADYIVSPEEFLSLGCATPFEGRRIFGRCLLTVHNGKIVYQA